MQIGTHGLRLLEAVGQPDATMLRDVDWGARGVTRPYVLFITGRCGSTWLGSLLAASGLIRNPFEYLNSNMAAAFTKPGIGLGSYFDAVVSHGTLNGRFGLQVDPQRLEDTLPLIDWGTVFPPEASMTFFLYRRDLVAQAWSWVSARKSSLWHSGDTGPTVPAPTLQELTAEVVRLRRAEEFVEGFARSRGYRPVYLDYEQLVAETDATVTKVLTRLRFTSDEIHPERWAQPGALKKLTYDDKAATLARFALRYPGASMLLQRRRFGVSSDRLAHILL